MHTLRLPSVQFEPFDGFWSVFFCTLAVTFTSHFFSFFLFFLGGGVVARGRGVAKVHYSRQSMCAFELRSASTLRLTLSSCPLFEGREVHTV